MTRRRSSSMQPSRHAYHGKLYQNVRISAPKWFDEEASVLVDGGNVNLTYLRIRGTPIASPRHIHSMGLTKNGNIIIIIIIIILFYVQCRTKASPCDLQLPLSCANQFQLAPANLLIS
ncbi:uncharacterized protein LOC142559479 [Dermacentor variabilis]|uniref:uncharacterized protein LOC142559479 n=1 Tax=Dermacentor variabilis TaxID=34621 RepID=UPI003F5B9F39